MRSICAKKCNVPPKKCAVSRKKQIQPTKKSGACQKKKSNPPTNLELVKKRSRAHLKILELVKKNKSNMHSKKSGACQTTNRTSENYACQTTNLSRARNKNMELVKKSRRRKKLITKKFESAKQSREHVKKKKGLPNIYAGPLQPRSCMLAYIYIYVWSSFSLSSPSLLYCIFIYTIIRSSFCPT